MEIQWSGGVQPTVPGFIVDDFKAINRHPFFEPKGDPKIIGTPNLCIFRRRQVTVRRTVHRDKRTCSLVSPLISCIFMSANEEHCWCLSKEVGKQYFRVTNDFYLMELTMMKGGARVRLDLDEGWCEPLHYMTIQQKRTDFDEGWCETLHYITIHQKRTDLDEGWCETLHYITIHE